MKLQGPSEVKDGSYYVYDTDSEMLGEGGMGRVYLGTRVDRNGGETKVAIKAMFEGLPDHVIERARREASIRLNNDSLVRMYAFIETSGVDVLGEPVMHYHVVSEYLDGISLADLIVGNLKDRSGNIHPNIKRIYSEYLEDRDRMATEIIKSVLSGIMALHDVGYIHRDIDPSNIMVTTDGKYKLIDFGVAKQLVRLNTTDKGLTSSGQFLGKAGYAAPELVLGDVRHQNFSTDVYAIGILYYQLLTGHLPFEGTSYNQMEAQLHKKISLKDIRSYQIKSVIGKATEKRQSDRYATSAQFRAAIDSFVFPEPWHASKAKVAWVIAAVIAVILTGAYFLIPEPPVEPTDEELFATYLTKLDSQDPILVAEGFEGMKELAGKGYQPAARQVALTYAWTNNTLYMQRKQLLGWGVDNAGLFEDKEKNIAAFQWLSKVVELSDSTDSEIMCLLSQYYINPVLFGGDVDKQSTQRALTLVEKSLEIQLEQKDSIGIERTKQLLQLINNKIITR